MTRLRDILKHCEIRLSTKNIDCLLYTSDAADE